MERILIRNSIRVSNSLENAKRHRTAFENVAVSDPLAQGPDCYSVELTGYFRVTDARIDP